jgi:hypothetical protein
MRDALPPLRRAREGAARLAKLRCPCRDRRLCALVPNRDLARFLRLGELTKQIDVEQAVFKARTGHLDVIGELRSNERAAIP